MNVLQKLYPFILLFSFGHLQANAQLILTNKKLVCPNEPVRLKINDKALSNTEFCVSKMANRYGLHYFRTCKQVEIEDAIIMAKIMNGYLATANDDAKNDFLFRLLPNDIHWIGYFQDTTSRNFNDPPDPASGFGWMSSNSVSKPYWVNGEPNNREDTNPGKYVVQGCRRTPEWCDIEEGLKFVGIIESKTDEIPTITNPRILWETGETTKEISVKPTKSKWYKVTIFYDTRTVTDSIYIQTPEATVEMSRPGGCNPYKWKPTIKTNAPLASLDITWMFKDSIILNQLKPEFITRSDGDIGGSVTVKSATCGIELTNEREIFDVQPMQPRPLVEAIVLLNEDIKLKPFNEGPFVYQWSPPFDLSDEAIYSPSFKATKPIEYSVVITDDFGCTTTEVFKFEIDPNLVIYVPTAFTPNADGKNDNFEFNLINNFYGEIKKLLIYNATGELIYEALPPYFTWDGTVKNENVPVGVYVYLIEYEVNGVSYAYKSTVNVIY